MERYQYQSAPQPVYAGSKMVSKSLYRKTQESEDLVKTQNIHFDRRVVRGNTYAAAITTLNQLQAQAAANAATRNLSRSTHRQQTKSKNNAQLQENANNVNASSQTDDYQEMLDDVIEVREFGLQTDDYDDEKPPPVMFIPAPAGVHVSVQIEKGELFDYDVAIVPITEVLLGKCFDTALNEVRQEEDQKNMNTRIECYEEERDAMIAQAQKLEEANIRQHVEISNRKEQEKVRLAEETKIREKLAAKRAAKEYLAGLEDKVLGLMECGGSLHDPIKHDVQNIFMPWLHENICQQLKKVKDTQSCIEDLVMDSIRHVYDEKAEIARQAEIARKLEEERLRLLEEARKEALRLEEEEKQRIIAEAELMLKEQEARLLAAALNDGEGEEGDFDMEAMDQADLMLMEEDDEEENNQ